MIKIEVDNTVNLEAVGSGEEILIDLTTAIHYVVYNMSKSKEQFAFFMLALNKMLNCADYEEVKEAFTE